MTNVIVRFNKIRENNVVHFTVNCLAILSLGIAAINIVS